MNNGTYRQMSDEELKSYVLAHRSDLEAISVYIERLDARPGERHSIDDLSPLEVLLRGKEHEQL